MAKIQFSDEPTALNTDCQNISATFNYNFSQKENHEQLWHLMITNIPSNVTYRNAFKAFNNYSNNQCLSLGEKQAALYYNDSNIGIKDQKNTSYSIVLVVSTKYAVRKILKLDGATLSHNNQTFILRIKTMEPLSIAKKEKAIRAWTKNMEQSDIEEQQKMYLLDNIYYYQFGKSCFIPLKLLSSAAILRPSRMIIDLIDYSKMNMMYLQNDDEYGMQINDENNQNMIKKLHKSHTELAMNIELLQGSFIKFLNKTGRTKKWKMPILITINNKINETKKKECWMVYRDINSLIIDNEIDGDSLNYIIDKFDNDQCIQCIKSILGNTAITEAKIEQQQKIKNILFAIFDRMDRMEPTTSYILKYKDIYKTYPATNTTIDSFERSMLDWCVEEKSFKIDRIKKILELYYWQNKYLFVRTISENIYDFDIEEAVKYMTKIEVVVGINTDLMDKENFVKLTEMLVISKLQCILKKICNAQQYKLNKILNITELIKICHENQKLYHFEAVIYCIKKQYKLLHQTLKKMMNQNVNIDHDNNHPFDSYIYLLTSIKLKKYIKIDTVKLAEIYYQIMINSAYYVGSESGNIRTIHIINKLENKHLGSKFTTHGFPV